MAQNWFVIQSLNPLCSVQLAPIQPQVPSIYNSPLLWPMTSPTQPIYLTVQPVSMGDMIGLTQDSTVRLQQPLRSVPPETQSQLIPSSSSGSRSSTRPLKNIDKQESEGSGELQKLKKRKPLDQFKKQSQNGGRSYRQNPSRNIVTNIGNQLITYLCSPGKSEARIRQIRPQYTRQDVDGFYAFTRKIKKQTDYYLNMHKMQDFWYPQHQGQNFKDYRKLLRILSCYFMTELLPPCILTSTKMKRETKLHHMRVRKQLISLLCRRAAFLPRTVTNLDHLYKTD